ncbi:MAG: hypothetical protein ACP5OA_07515 [Candidatus Woesearchaeota archaeon]
MASIKRYSKSVYTRLGKKGQVQYFLENAFRIGFLMIALLIFFLLVNFYVINKIDTNRIQAEVTANRIMYSDAFMYQENLRTYIGIVDAKKFNDDRINSKINYPIKRHATAKLELYDNDDMDIAKYTAYLNKAQYDILYTLTSSGGAGKGSATLYTKTYPITYLDNNVYRYGTIRMKIIIPNS